MFSLFMGSARINALEDAVGALNKINNSKEVKVHGKKDFEKIKKKKKNQRECHITNKLKTR